jgi:hypothetical protein
VFGSVAVRRRRTRARRASTPVLLVQRPQGHRLDAPRAGASGGSRDERTAVPA